jgi:hypothetical protein
MRNGGRSKLELLEKRGFHQRADVLLVTFQVEVPMVSRQTWQPLL